MNEQDLEECAKMKANIRVLGFDIFIDRSGVGHNWQLARLIDCGQGDQEEIATEILENGKDKEGDWNYHQVADRKYRW